MSNRNNQNNGNQNQVNLVPAPEKAKKPGIVAKIINTKDKILASKAGRIGLGLLRIGAVGAAGFFGFKAGVKSVKPTTVYIREGVTEEPQETEPAKEEETTETAE